MIDWIFDMRRQLSAAIVLIAFASSNAYAFFFIFPIPNLAKPSALQATIDALEKSVETRALAFVSEDKSFGGKVWVWGKHASAEVSQETADRYALEQCERSLLNAKAKTEGGQLLYNFGDKKCELHPFTPNDGPKIAEARKKAAAEEAQRLAAIEEAKRLAVEEERKKLATEEEAKKVAAEEDAKKIAAEEEAKRIAAEVTAKNKKPGALGKTKATSNSGQSDVTARLSALKSLADKGLITKDDYEAKKQAILKSM